GDVGFPPGKTGLKKQWLNFSPRVGVAWDVHGDGRTAVRTSYGIGYDFPTGERHNINAGAPPWGNRSLLQDPPGLLDDPYSYVGCDPHPGSRSTEPPPVHGASATRRGAASRSWRRIIPSRRIRNSIAVTATQTGRTSRMSRSAMKRPEWAMRPSVRSCRTGVCRA